MTFTIRPGHPDDAVLLGAVEKAAASRFSEIGLSQIAEGRPVDQAEYRALAEAGRLWVAETEEGAPVGVAFAGEVDGAGHLAEISVHPNHGRQGLGRRLIAEVESWARASGYASLSLTTFRDVPWNRPYYEKLGFSEVEEGEAGPKLRSIREGERGRGLDALSPRLCMVKTLVPVP